MDEKLMQAVCDSTERFVAHVGPTQFELPTPCSEWTVRELLNHLVGTLHLCAALLNDEMPPMNAGPDQAPTQDLIGDDPARAYCSGVGPLVAATTPDAVGRAHATPLGDMPGMALAGFAALDVLVHGWDLAKATGQTPDIDPALAQPLLEFALQFISDDMTTRGPRIGPKVTPPRDADAMVQLVAYMGRTP
jgi:uncharacterized protein (TIGR03086 family)